MRSAVWTQAFLCFCLISCQVAFGLDDDSKDQRPGSRTLYVRNHPDSSNELPEFLLLSLRRCNCRQVASEELCRCWSSCNSQDMPVVQGDARNVIELMKLLPGDFNLGFNFGSIYGTNEQYIQVPSPKSLVNELKKFGLHDYIEHIDSDALVTPKKYLALLAQRKIPLAGVVLNAKTTDAKYIYKTYFHDLFNHVLLWIMLPDKIRNHISQRALIINKALFKYLRQHGKSPYARNYGNLFRSYLALQFDDRMAGLNNLIFKCRHPNLLSFTAYSTALIALETSLLENMIDLGMPTEINPSHLVYAKNDKKVVKAAINAINKYLETVQLHKEKKGDNLLEELLPRDAVYCFTIAGSQTIPSRRLLKCIEPFGAIPEQGMFITTIFVFYEELLNNIKGLVPINKTTP